jgi:general nucleoside transport system ATP-binding protein
MLIPPPPPPSTSALDVECLHMTKRFGAFTALSDVSIKVHAGSFHALLGENGAGKSTLVKCIVGFYRADEGSIQIDSRERTIATPQDAHALGIGMVYQHFTLIPSMTVAENLVMSRAAVPAVLNWRHEREALASFMVGMPFKVDLEAPVNRLAAGEKQKVEILKQIYLRRRFLILDEPTSVLTPAEADEVLGLLHAMTRKNELTILMISHKLREVMAFADEVTVLRRGRMAGAGKVAELTPAAMAEMMIGSKTVADGVVSKVGEPGAPQLALHDLTVLDDTGLPAVEGVSLSVRANEIVGIAGVSGNGQRELVEALIGQRVAESGTVTVKGELYRATRPDMQRHRVHSLPEEPLRNACVPAMSVAENIAFRNFDRPPLARGPLLSRRALIARGARLIADYKVKTTGPDAPIRTLSGGNVQRAVLARELSAKVDVLIVANPVFGLDIAAIAEIHARLLAARNDGTAILLVSEDLDELLELSDRIVVMFDGKLVYETPGKSADVAAIGRHMAGHGTAFAPGKSVAQTTFGKVA